jgi:hypothetical protein
LIAVLGAVFVVGCLAIAVLSDEGIDRENRAAGRFELELVLVLGLFIFEVLMSQ